MRYDPSRGYDAIANDYVAARSGVGSGVIARWAKTLPAGGAVLDVGAGSGVPLTERLIEAGLDVSAIDASPKMVAAFKARFPDIPVACETAEASSFFGRPFDGVLAIGLIFLLTESAQRQALAGMATALKTGGSLLYSAPRQACEWIDVLTNEPSRSLGDAVYRETLSVHGLNAGATYEDEGGNFYYEAWKR